MSWTVWSLTATDGYDRLKDQACRCENWPIYLQTITKLTNKPLIVSEFGGPSSQYEVYSEKYHAQRLKKYIETLRKMPVKEAYYFNLVDNPNTYHSKSGLMTSDLKGKKAYHRFKNATSQ